MEFKESSTVHRKNLPLALLVIWAGYFIAAFVILSLIRMRYPFDLEWVEGALVDELARILDGKPLYEAPSIAHAPFPYAPLAFYFSAALSKLFGLGYLPLRVLSILSTLTLMGILFLFVRKQSGKWALGLIAAGLFASTYKLSAYWFDLARVDMPFLALLAIGAYLLYFHPTKKMAALAAILLALSFFAKQTALGPILALSIFVLLFHRNLLLYFFVPLLLLLAAGLFFFQWLSDGWFFYYAFEVVRHHGLFKSRIFSFWSEDLLAPLFPMISLGLLYLFSIAKKLSDRRFWFALLFSGSLLGVSFLSRIKNGGAMNTLIPLHFVLALYAPLGLDAFLREKSKLAAQAQSRLRPIGALLFLFLFFQFAIGSYAPARFIPPEGFKQEGHRALQLLRNIPGDVWVLRYGNLSRRVGKKPMAHISTMKEVLRADQENKVFRDEILRSIRERRLGAIVVDRGAIPHFAKRAIAEHYEATSHVIRLIRWQTHYGWDRTAEHIFLPKPRVKKSPPVKKRKPTKQIPIR